MEERYAQFLANGKPCLVDTVMLPPAKKPLINCTGLLKDAGPALLIHRKVLETVNARYGASAFP